MNAHQRRIAARAIERGDSLFLDNDRHRKIRFPWDRIVCNALHTTLTLKANQFRLRRKNKEITEWNSNLKKQRG